MAPSKITKACKAMKTYGIGEATVKPVLKKLLDLYDKNWKYIEDENYRVLIDAIFDNENPKVEELTKKQGFKLRDEPEECESPPMKKFRSQRDESSSHVGDSNTTPLKMQHKEEAQVLQFSCQLKVEKSIHQHLGDETCPGNVSTQGCNDKRKKPISQGSSLILSKKVAPLLLFDNDENTESSPEAARNGGSSLSCQHKESKKIIRYERGRHLVRSKEWTPSMSNQVAVLPQFEVPLAVIHPDAKEHGLKKLPQLVDQDVEDMSDPSPADEDDSSNLNRSEAKETGSKFLIHLDEEHKTPLQLLSKAGSSKGNCSNLEFLDNHLDAAEGKEDGASQIDIASSPTGEVKISLICNSCTQPNFQIPSLDAVFKAVEEKCLKSYKITDPSFSLLKVMKDLCEYVLAEGTISANGEQVSPQIVSSDLDGMETSKQLVVSDGGLNKEDSFSIPLNFSDGSVKFQNLFNIRPHIPRLHISNGMINSSSMEIVQKQGTSLSDLLNTQCFVEDITRGEEIHKISLVNQINSEGPPSFTYIPRNITYENAYVKFLLVRISDDDCCSHCIGDCTSQEIPCACAGETGGEFAYTTGGLVKEDFLDKCISMKQNSEQNLFYCKDCPLQRSNNSETCYGHVVRKFIKECWYKCSCSKSCGNRVVQRGITANLQVFMTPEGKGWGLRTLKDLPKGSFICEYVGEIVTNTELDERNKQNIDEKHTYPVLLDADWGSEGVLKDEEALCLDATSYGNVARFINHRCGDANMVEIPVEVETPDHHYYHVAFFTARKVDALEELTWDYGIDFGDINHPIKAFQCRCGSNFCKCE